MLDLIRGRDVNAALATLRFARKSVARDIEKVLRSAIANAQQKEGFGGDVERLYVAACYANQGPSQKRIRPAPMGRAFRVVKRTAHLTVAVTERPIEGRRRRRAGRERAEAAARRQAEGRSGGRARRSAAKTPRRRRRGVASAKKTAAKTERLNYGTESSSARIPARVQQDLALALVRGPRLREAAARGSEAARQAQGAVRPRRRLEDRDRARGQQAEDRHLHLAAGHHHRPQGDGGRQAEDRRFRSRPTARSSSTSRRSRSRSSTRS